MSALSIPPSIYFKLYCIVALTEKGGNNPWDADSHLVKQWKRVLYINSHQMSIELVNILIGNVSVGRVSHINYLGCDETAFEYDKCF